jgi:putative ABC transport system permease protein
MLMERLITEARQALRRLAKTPGFTAVVLLTLALGIGANSAIFSIVNGVLLRPLPFPEPDRLVTVTHLYPSLDGLEPGFSAGTFRDVVELSGSFEEVGAESGWVVNLTGEGEPEQLFGNLVSERHFAAYGVSAALGRTILPSDVEAEARVVVLSHGLWRRLGENAAVIGSRLMLNGEPYEVVGVMPEHFRGFFNAQSQLWAPVVITPGQLANRGNEFLSVTARLRPGTSPARAQQEMETLAARLREQNPEAYPEDWTLRVRTFDELATGEIRPALLVLLGAVAFVLLIACANVANLLLARASARRKEIAIRGAMGARRRHILLQLLMEGVILALLGGALGLLLAEAGLSLLRATNPLELARVEELRVDATVLGFTALLAVVTGILFGLAPALQLAGTDLQTTLREGGRSGGGGGDRRGQTVRRALVVGQVALALTLLIGAGLLIRSFSSLQRVDPGFQPEGVLTFQVPVPATRYDTPEKRLAFHLELDEHLTAIPGATGVGRASKLPFTPGMSTRSFAIEGLPMDGSVPLPWGDFRVVDEGFHSTLQIPLVRGRGFTSSDHADAPPVAIVDQEMVRRYWPHEDPIGKRLAYLLDEEGSPIWIEVVGVVGHTLVESLDGDRRVQLYRPHRQVRDGFMTYVIRTPGDPLALVPAVRAAVRAVDPEQPIAEVGTLRALLDTASGERRLSMSLLGLFAGIALLLASLGIYGVIAFDVSRRAQEMGVRIALGAETRGILMLVMRHGVRLTLAGIGIGLLAAVLLTRVLSAQLFGVRPVDPATFAVVPLALAAVAALASYIPARRATRVDPMVALRDE